jgi:hypothetical protein
MSILRNGVPTQTQLTSSDPVRFAAIVSRAERRFRRVLGAWTGDLLELRRREAVKACSSSAIPAHRARLGGATQGERMNQPMKDAA